MTSGTAASPFRIVAEAEAHQKSNSQQRLHYENWKDKNIRLDRVPNLAPNRSYYEKAREL